MTDEVNANNVISIHAPREGGDSFFAGFGAIMLAFQSTPPARGATVQPGTEMFVWSISIHAPREGGDCSG